MKNIIITENQYKRLVNEMVQNGFSFEKLNSIISPKGKYAYCKDYLGDDIGFGVSRYVFDYDDNTVLKLAGDRNFALKQNKTECDFYNASNKSPLVCKIYDHADDYSWILSEQVIPCKPIDFYKLLGMPYSDSIKYRNYDETEYAEYPTAQHNKHNVLTFMDFLNFAHHPEKTQGWKPKTYQECIELMHEKPWFAELYRLIHEVHLEDTNGGNFGIAKRNGEPTLVILDSGN